MRRGSPQNIAGACKKEADCGGDRTTDFCQAQAKFPKLAGLTVRNQFHGSEQRPRGRRDQARSASGPDVEGAHGALPPPVDVAVDHYKCYTVAMPKGETFAPITEVEVKDQFTTAQLPAPGKKLFDLKKPSRVCMAAAKNAEAMVNPTQNLFCYQAIPTKGQPKHQKVSGLYLTNQFGLDQADTVKEEEFCVPSEVELPGDGESTAS